MSRTSNTRTGNTRVKHRLTESTGEPGPDQFQRIPRSDQRPEKKSRRAAPGFQGYARWELWLVSALALAGFVPRLLLLVKSNFIIESDEAIVGLMAKHMLQGRPWPVFYYGQDYMGSLEGTLAALAFAVLGQSGASLKLVPLLFSLGQIALVFALARRFVRPVFAGLAGLLTAVGPSGLVLWSSMARGGFIELVVLGSLALVIATDILQQRNFSRGKMIALGLVLGLGWWVNNQILFYMAPIGVCVAYGALRELKIRESLEAAGLCLGAFFLGGLPFWYQNLFVEPRMSTFRTLFGTRAGGRTLEYLQGYFDTALPIVFGARRFWSHEDVFRGATLLAFSVYCIVLLVVLLCLRSFTQPRPSSKVAEVRTLPLVMLLLFCAVVPIIFASSSFGWLSVAPRYLLPLYSVIFVLVAIACEQLWLSRFTPLRALPAVIFAALIGIHLASLYRGGIAIAGQPAVFDGQRVAESHTELYRLLKERGYQHIHTNYWIGYRVAFETDERVTFSRYGHPRSLRIPEYEENARPRQFPPVYVLVTREAELLALELKQFGYGFRSTRAGEYVVIDRIQPAWDRGPEVKVLPQQISATSRQEQVANIVDGDRQTRWGSGMPQRPGMKLEISFPIPQSITGVELDLGPFVHDAPRNLVIEGVDENNQNRTLFMLQGSKVFRELQAESTSEVDPRWQISFAPQKLKALRLLQIGSTPVFDWSIAELKLYQPAEATK